MTPKRFRNSKYLKVPGQGDLLFDLRPPGIISIRGCPSDPEHVVFGEPYHIGGRIWYCAECGIEWRASLKSKFVKYSMINVDGSTTVLKKIPLHHFVEYQQHRKKHPEEQVQNANSFENSRFHTEQKQILSHEEYQNQQLKFPTFE